MKIVCDSCGAKYSIADEKVAGKIFKIRCKKCSSVLEVRGDQTGAHPFADAGAQDSAGEAVWYIVIDGEQKGPLPPIELSQLFAKGTVGLDSYVWKESFEDWKVASDVPELAQIFGGAAAQAPQATAQGGDDTSSFGTGGDLFSDGGREPTSEIDTNSSMFAGFDEAPTPTESEGAPLAASSENDAGGVFGGGAAGLGGGGMAAAAPQRMTGQRNENSVLFSLSNLQQLASRGGSAGEAAPVVASQPMSGGQSAPPAAGEGSGLIDIRALAKSTTPGTKSAPSQAVDDLLAIGGGGGTLGAPLLGPAPLETSDGNRWLWIAGAAVAVIAIVGAGVGVGMALGGSDDDALEIAAPTAQQPQTNQAAPTPVPGTNEAANTAPAPEEPPQEAAVVDIEPEEPAEAATIQDPARPAPKNRTSSSTQRRQRTAKSTSSKPAPAPKRKSNNLDALMDEVVGGSSSSKPKTTTRSTSSSSSSNLPDAPSRNDVKKALQGVSGAVKACRKDAGGTATVNVTFSGKTGRATGARITSGPFKGTPVGSCVESAVKRARVPRFKQSSFKVTFPYRL
ncbi:MAG: zinc-ribbon domain-containing protein [Myxococcales bacterium]|nr:MAG: zinc-ribbon domain-containing protein [Myxococcales bacterium]